MKAPAGLDVTIELAPGEAHGEVRRALDAMGLSLEAMYPGETDPALARYHTVRVADEDAGRRVVARVRGLPAVRGAYVKPPGSPP